MKRKFVSNLILVLVLNFIIKPFYILGIDAEILKITELNNAGTYGTYFSLLSLSFVFNIFLDLGINNYNTRNIARDNNKIHGELNGNLSLKLALSFIYILLLFSVGIIFSYNWYEIKWLIVIGFNQILVALILFMRSNLSALFLLKEDSFISVLDRIILILFCGYFLWAGTTNTLITIEFFILSQTLAYTLTLIICIAILKNKIREFKLHWNIPFFKSTIQKSLPYALLIFLMSIYYYSDVVMIERMKNNYEAVSYAHGYRFFMAFNMVGYLFAGLLLPVFSKMIKEGNNVSSITWLSFRLIFLIAILICASIWPIKDELLFWRYEIIGDNLLHSSKTFGWLLLSFIAISCNYIFGTLLTANGSLKQLNIMASTGVFINLFLNMILIPEYGSEGAAFASLITQLFTLFSQIIISYRQFHFQLFHVGGIQLLAFIILTCITSYTIHYLNLFSTIWYINIITTLIVGGVFSLILRLVSIKDIFKLVKSHQNELI